MFYAFFGPSCSEGKIELIVPTIPCREFTSVESFFFAPNLHTTVPRGPPVVSSGYYRNQHTRHMNTVGSIAVLLENAHTDESAIIVSSARSHSIPECLVAVYSFMVYTLCSELDCTSILDVLAAKSAAPSTILL